MIVKGNSDWAEKFLEDWLVQMHTPGVDTEQLGFEAVYRSRAIEEMQAKVAILPAHVLNSIATPMGQQLPHHQVCSRPSPSNTLLMHLVGDLICLFCTNEQILHLAAESTSMRASVFRHAAISLCTAFVAGRSPLQQLGITRKYLQKTAKQV